MPPTNLSPQEERSNKQIALGIIGLIALLIVAGVWYVFRGNPFAPKQAAETSDILTSQKSVPQVVDTRPIASAGATAKEYILPSSKVTTAYTSVYNAVANETIAIENSYKNELGPLLTRAQTAIKSKDYRALPGIGKEAKIINDAQKIRLAALSTGLDSLATVSKTLHDQETISLTNSSVFAGKAYVAKHSALSALVDEVLTGNVSSQTVTQAKSVPTEVALAAKVFFDANKKLSDYFVKTIENDANALLTASAAQGR